MAEAFLCIAGMTFRALAGTLEELCAGGRKEGRTSLLSPASLSISL